MEIIFYFANYFLVKTQQSNLNLQAMMGNFLSTKDAFEVQGSSFFNIFIDFLEAKIYLPESFRVSQFSSRLILVFFRRAGNRKLFPYP